MNKQSQVRMTLTNRSAGPAKVTAAILLAGSVVGLAACTSTTHTAQPHTTSPAASPANTKPATASQATCKHVNSLRGSLESLTHIQLSPSSAGQIRTNLGNIQTQLAALRGHAGTALSHQVNQLSSSVNEVNKAAGNLSTPPSTAQINKVVNALSGLKAQSRSAVAKMKAACP